MNQKTNLQKVNHVRLRMVSCALFFIFSSFAQAQKIDFDNGNNSSYVSSGYETWNSFEVKSSKSVSKTIDGVTITISHGVNTQANLIKSNWYKNGVSSQTATNDSKLICDGIFAGMENDDYGGYGITTQRVAINVTLKGLSAGVTHNIKAYHNYLNGGENITLPTIGVSVNGTTKESGIVQTQQATSLSEAASSFVEFTVNSISDEVTITYFSEPKSNTTYTTTYFYINSLEIDAAADVEYQAQNPYPANMDYHVATNNSNLTMTWEAAPGATKHQIYFGNNESQVRNASNYDLETTSTSFIRNGLDPMQTYYWRVDEVINGQVYRGEVWSFRSRRLAFPGAEGAGKYAIGGRGGDVYHVTNLNDSGEGSLRYGLENAAGPRTIVFDVSGVIQLQSRLVCNKPYITIAGQTAPGIGIMLRDYDFGAFSDDGITRFLRFRYGHGDDWDGRSANQFVGNAAGLIADHAIMDHCLLGWGSDETFSSRGAKNISFQHSLIGESLNQNGHKNYYDENPNVQHGYAATVGGEVASLHHNLLAHNEGRNWSLGGGLDGTNHFAGRMNIYNNVCYNWGGRATDGGAHQVNFVGNYYKMGPSTTQNKIFIANHEDNYAGTQEYYLHDNLRVSQDGKTKKSDTLNDTYSQTISSGITVNWTTFVSSPYSDFYGLDESNVESVEAAFKNVLSDVGCNYESLDNNEKRLVQETLKGTFSKTGSRSGKKGLIDKESDSEGWNGLGIISETRDSDWDTDGDGIPNWFETEKGWNTSDLNNNHVDGSSTGWYTDLEIYLNWMACPHFIDLKVGVEKTIDLATYFAGYTNPSYTIVTNDIDVSISNKKLVVNPTTSGLFSVQVKATENSISLTRTFNFYVKPAEEQDENVYNEASVDMEENDYLIAISTHTTDESKTVWGFENGFKVINNGDKGYGTGFDDCVKFSAGVPFTIVIPEGISVSEVSIEGYDNYNSKDSYLSKLGENVYNSSDYVFQKKDASNNRIIYTYSITLDNPVSESLLFQFNDNQTVVKISLKCVKTSNVNITLKETATAHFPYKKGAEALFTAQSLPIKDANVTLQRTLSNSFWNSFCVPFDISQEQIDEIFGGGEVLEFESATRSTVKFKTVEGIRAGVPCLFKPANSVEIPMFSHVDITEAVEEKSSSDAGFSFDGHFSRYDMATDKTEFFLSTDGKLYYPNANQNHLLGMRATFTVPPVAARQGVIRMMIEEDMVSEDAGLVDGLQSIDGGYMMNQPVYNLNGQKVGSTRSELYKGVYIVNGRKVIIK